MIVFTNPIAVPNETNTIHALFECGLELLHVRKPNYSVDGLRLFLSKVNPEFRSQLVLHQQHQVANEFGIHRIHFTESARAALDLELKNNTC